MNKNLFFLLPLGAAIAQPICAVQLPFVETISTPHIEFFSQISSSSAPKKTDLPSDISSEIISIKRTIAMSENWDSAPQNTGTKLVWLLGWEQWKKEIPALLSVFEESGDVNLTSPSGFTLLQAASFYDKIALAKYLISQNIGVNIRPKNYTELGFPGETPLGLALQNCKMVSCSTMAKLLLDYGGNPDATMIENRPAFQPSRSIPLLQSSLSNEAKLLLLQYGEQDLKKRIPKHSMLSLTSCNFGGYTDIDYNYVEALLKHGFDPNTMGEKCYTLLLNAIQRGDLALAELLLKNGADPNLRSRYFQTPLFNLLNGPLLKENMVLKVEKAAAMAKLLIKHGADVNAMTYPKTGESLRTHYGKIKGATPIIEILKEAGAELYPDAPNSKTKKGKEKRH